MRELSALMLPVLALGLRCPLDSACGLGSAARGEGSGEGAALPGCCEELTPGSPVVRDAGPKQEDSR